MKVHFRYLHTIRAVDPYSIGILDRQINSQKFKRMDDCLDPYSIGILDRRSVRNARRSRERVLILTLLEY